MLIMLLLVVETVIIVTNQETTDVAKTRNHGECSEAGSILILMK
jgi:hypothetical protein